MNYRIIYCSSDNDNQFIYNNYLAYIIEGYYKIIFYLWLDLIWVKEKILFLFYIIWCYNSPIVYLL